MTLLLLLLSIPLLFPWPRLLNRRHSDHHPQVTAGTCVSCFLAALPMLCRGGVYMFTLMEWHTASWAILLLGFAEVSCSRRQWPTAAVDHGSTRWFSLEWAFLLGLVIRSCSRPGNNISSRADLDVATGGAGQRRLIIYLTMMKCSIAAPFPSLSHFIWLKSINSC